MSTKTEVKYVVQRFAYRGWVEFGEPETESGARETMERNQTRYPGNKFHIVRRVTVEKVVE